MTTAEAPAAVCPDCRCVLWPCPSCGVLICNCDGRVSSDGIPQSDDRRPRRWRLHHYEDPLLVAGQRVGQEVP